MYINLVCVTVPSERNEKEIQFLVIVQLSAMVESQRKWQYGTMKKNKNRAKLRLSRNHLNIPAINNIEHF